MKRKALFGLAVTLALATVVVVAPSCSKSPTVPPEMFSECGTIQGIGCPVGETCELPAAQCNTADLAGVCLQIPDLCTAQYDPVCGCDGKTYGNDCERLRERVQKSHDGECT